MITPSGLPAAIPFLRRYARALCGSQEQGDAAVLSMLERLVHDRAMDVNSKRDLFASFSKTWNENVNLEEPSLGERSIDRNVGSLSPMARQVFLLSALEGFSDDDLVIILLIEADTVAGLHKQAGSEMAAQMRTNVLIVEDERMIALDIEQAVQALGHDVIAIARTEAEAVAAFAQHKPGLVLCDIQLADGSSGIDAVETMLSKLDVPVIFVTAYPDRLLTGKRPEPTYLLEKPMHPQTLKALVSQALFVHEGQADLV